MLSASGHRELLTRSTPRVAHTKHTFPTSLFYRFKAASLEAASPSTSTSTCLSKFSARGTSPDHAATSARAWEMDYRCVLSTAPLSTLAAEVHDEQQDPRSAACMQDRQLRSWCLRPSVAAFSWSAFLWSLVTLSHKSVRSLGSVFCLQFEVLACRGFGVSRFWRGEGVARFWRVEVSQLQMAFRHVSQLQFRHVSQL